MVCIFGCTWKFWLCGRSLLWRGGATGCSKGNVQVRTWQKTSCFTYRADVWLVLFFFGSCFSKNWCSSSVSYVAAQACGGAWCLQLGLTKHSWMSHQFDLFVLIFLSNAIAPNFNRSAKHRCLSMLVGALVLYADNLWRRDNMTTFSQMFTPPFHCATVRICRCGPVRSSCPWRSGRQTSQRRQRRLLKRREPSGWVEYRKTKQKKLFDLCINTHIYIYNQYIYT